MSWGELVTVVNRTSKPQEFVFDGQTYVLKPGENHGYRESLAGFAKSKFPVMGTEDPYNPISFICLIGVKEWNDPITPLEQSDSIERMDRTMLNDSTRRVGVTVGAKGGVWRPMAGEGIGNAALTTEFRGGDGTA